MRHSMFETVDRKKRAEQLRADAMECKRAGFHGFAEVNWDTADWLHPRDPDPEVEAQEQPRSFKKRPAPVQSAIHGGTNASKPAPTPNQPSHSFTPSHPLKQPSIVSQRHARFGRNTNAANQGAAARNHVARGSASRDARP
jgi:hypothetical protein